MNGPDFLYLPFEEMPFSRQFLDQNFKLPDQELRTKKLLLYTTRVEMKEDPLLSLAIHVMKRTDKLSKAIGVLARLVKANFSQNTNMIQDIMTPSDRIMAT